MCCLTKLKYIRTVKIDTICCTFLKVNAHGFVDVFMAFLS